MENKIYFIQLVQKVSLAKSVKKSANVRIMLYVTQAQENVVARMVGQENYVTKVFF